MQRPFATANLTTLVTALYVKIDDDWGEMYDDMWPQWAQTYRSQNVQSSPTPPARIPPVPARPHP